MSNEGAKFAARGLPAGVVNDGQKSKFQIPNPKQIPKLKVQTGRANRELRPDCSTEARESSLARRAWNLKLGTWNLFGIWDLGFGIFSIALALLLNLTPIARAQISAGPAFSEFRLTLDAGRRTEILGPVFYSEERDETSQWAIPPLMSYTHDRGVDGTEFDILYPILTYDRTGGEYRFQILQLFNFAGGVKEAETNKHRFSLFPVYLQQISDDPSENYFSLLPIYGRLKNRFFRDEFNFVLLPLYLETRKRDLHTYNYLFPIFHWRTGDGLKGWQFWPLAGHEHKVPTLRTNLWGDAVPVPGHDKKFFAWPLFFDQRAGIGSANEEHTQAFLPLYSFTRSPLRDATAVPFVLGWSSVHDRAKKFHEIGAPWPLIVFRRGETSRTDRVWPLFSRATNQFLESTWYAWPIYKYNRVHSDPLDRDRTRLLLFLYSHTTERNTETGKAKRRRDLWPLYTWRSDWDGNSRLQLFAPLEPILPNSKSIERNWSPLWSVWRDERNAKTSARSQSLLWNLYHRETDTDASRTAALFGLVQHTSNTNESCWRLFWWPEKKAETSR